MGSDDLTLLQAFESEYGIPDGFFVAGLVCTTVARSMSGANVGPQDFIPYFRPPDRPQTPAETMARFRAHRDALAQRGNADGLQFGRKIGQ